MMMEIVINLSTFLSLSGRNAIISASRARAFVAKTAGTIFTPVRIFAPHSSPLPCVLIVNLERTESILLYYQKVNITLSPRIIRERLGLGGRCSLFLSGFSVYERHLFDSSYTYTCLEWTIETGCGFNDRKMSTFFFFSARFLLLRG